MNNNLSDVTKHELLSVSLEEMRAILLPKCFGVIDKLCDSDADPSKQKSKVPCLGNVIQPGGGKSHIHSQTAIYAYEKNKPSVILTPNNRLVDETVQLEKRLLSKKLKDDGYTKNQINEHLSEIVGYHGRQGINEKKYGTNMTKYGRKYACFQIKTVETAGDKNQPIAPNVCRTCPNGHLGEILYGDKNRIWEHEQWFIDNSIDKKAYEKKDCQFLRIAMKEQLAAKMLVAPSDSYSIGMGNWTDDVDKIERAVIVDENIALNRKVEIVQSEVKKVKDAIDKALIKMRDDNIKKANEHGERDFALTNSYKNPKLAHIDTTEAKEALAYSIEQLYLRIQHVEFYESLSQTLWLITSEMGNETLSDDLKNRVLDDHATLRKFDLMTGGTLRFERISHSVKTIENEYLDEFYVPLRFFHDFAIAVKNNTVIIRKQSYIIYTETQICTKAKEKGGVIFSDATMPHEQRRLIEFTGGEVVNIHVPQNLNLTRVIGHFYARGIPNSKAYKAKVDAWLRDAIAFNKDMKQQHGGEVANLAHKAFYGQLAKGDVYAQGDPEGMIMKLAAKHGVEFGWFGKHDRGHNDWIHHHQNIFSHTVLSNEADAISNGYDAARAVMLSCGDEGWGEWSGEMEKVTKGAPMPLDSLDKNGNMSRAKDWYVESIVAGLVQAIGRSRAVSSKHLIQVRLIGGIDSNEIDDGLARYGLTVAKRVENPHHVGPDDYYQRGITDDQIKDVILDMHKRGKPISADKVIDEILLLIRTGVADFDCGARKTRICEQLEAIRCSNQIPPATRAGRPAKPALPEPVPEPPALEWMDEFIQEERALAASTLANKAPVWQPEKIHCQTDEPYSLMRPAIAPLQNIRLATVWQ